MERRIRRSQIVSSEHLSYKESQFSNLQPNLDAFASHLPYNLSSKTNHLKQRSDRICDFKFTNVRATTGQVLYCTDHKDTCAITTERMCSIWLGIKVVHLR